MKRQGIFTNVKRSHFILCAIIVVFTTAVITSFNLYYVIQDGSPGPSVYAINDAGNPVLRNISLLHSFTYIPQSVVRTWEKRDFLIVFGIPSVDIPRRQRRRYLQRTSCWRLPGVATRLNDFSGAMLVLYVLARHQLYNFTYSVALEEEAAEWHDVIALPMNEGRTTTKKMFGGSPTWGRAADLGLSRKVFLWFDMALRLFPNVSYIGKGDDDMLLRVPQYLTDLRTLPLRGVYWGAMYRPRIRDGNVTVKFVFALGPCYTLTRDVADRLVTYKPLEHLLELPYTKEREAEFFAMQVTGEDSMVGMVLKKAEYYPKMQFFEEKPCSFHDIHGGVRPRPLRSTSILVHSLLESEYEAVMNRFRMSSGAVARRRKHLRGNRVEFSCR
ncbi:putative UDP-Gal or UDP-GlcNAc-dependent glycosyltransferase [Trypanosoma grayi]|uniref:putative UDP-Gal or UDP-GlcNAc-dependent glycosyltransferase n=1 Tax=Trypanosoma grayi TaxID=71804 RepID=UPI0004F3FF93|nr:putative UDP-Gal or UDP-GlcNAc-dependent glycosyltransferase [Trypanosoma grayi]KEG09208.1 putative UDP-Gal or UDP-GlcNAc-dependent glycosyltransferase [Trypanosoma grayi]